MKHNNLAVSNYELRIRVICSRTRLTSKFSIKYYIYLYDCFVCWSMSLFLLYFLFVFFFTIIFPVIRSLLAKDYLPSKMLSQRLAENENEIKNKLSYKIDSVYVIWFLALDKIWNLLISKIVDKIARDFIYNRLYIIYLSYTISYNIQIKIFFNFQ